MIVKHEKNVVLALQVTLTTCLKPRQGVYEINLYCHTQYCKYKAIIPRPSQEHPAHVDFIPLAFRYECHVNYQIIFQWAL